MPGRNTPLVNEEFYHVFNRGSDKRNIFIQPRDYKRFSQTFIYYQFLNPKPRFSNFVKSKLSLYKPDPSSKLIDIVCYCLMPNHFHFLLKQIKINGISIFLSQISNSYTKYFNTKYKRIGALLEGPFKAKRIENDEQFLHLSRYIHLNPVVSGLTRSLTYYPWSSYEEYMSSPFVCDTNKILGFFPSKRAYREFLETQIEYGKTLEIIKHQIFDEDED